MNRSDDVDDIEDNDRVLSICVVVAAAAAIFSSACFSSVCVSVELKSDFELRYWQNPIRTDFWIIYLGYVWHFRFRKIYEIYHYILTNYKINHTNFFFYQN